MIRPIAISLSPNTEPDDVLLALRTLFSPAKWRDSCEVKLLEKEFAARFGPNFQALAVNSGRSAQYLILQALGVGRGDEVAVQAFTCTVVPNSTIWLGAKPLYIDIDQSYNMRPDDLEKKITEKTKAVVVQHTFGIPADVAAIKKIAQQNNIVLIEDCAHALGATYQNHPVGSLGDIAFFSFGRDKVLSSVFGGMILCSDPKLYDQIKALRERLAIPSQAWVVQQLLHPLAFSLILPLYNFQIGKVILVLLQKLGLLSKAVYREEKLAQQPKIFPQKMPGGLAVLARHQLKKLDRFTQHRREIAQIYFDSLRNSGLQLAPDVSGASWLRFPIQHPQARDLYRYAKRQGVLLGDWYRGVVMPTADLSTVKYQKGSCPLAEKMSAAVINLPTHPTLTPKQAQQVVKIITEWLITQ